MAKIGIADRLNRHRQDKIIFGGEFEKIQLDPRTLIPSEKNSYSQTNIEELADNMLDVGMLQEIVVGRVNGEDRIAIGHRRQLAAILNIERGHKEFALVDCKMKEMTETMFMLSLHSANLFNRNLTDWERNEGIRVFTEYLYKAQEEGELKIEGQMRDYLARITGMATGTLGKINRINNALCEEGKEAFEKGDINFSTAYEMSKMPEEKQKEAIATDGLLSDTVKKMVEEDAKASKSGEMSQCDTETGEEEFEPQPGKINSICYSCQHCQQCNMRSNTTVECNEYKNKAEAEKTDKQRYSEKQDAIDRQTAARLRDQADAEKMKTLPSDSQPGPKIHRIKLAAMYYDDIMSGKKPFELRKNDRGYKESDLLELLEFKDAKHTGRAIKARVTYILEEYTGIAEGYCIMGIKVIELAAGGNDE